MQIDQTDAIATRIREARSFTGLSQENFAAVVGTSRRHLIRWEKAHARPRPRSLRLIADAAGVSPEWLAGRTQEVHPQAPSRTRAQGSRSDDSASNGIAAAPETTKG